MRGITCIEDLRRLAQRKVPRAFFDYAEAGSYSEETLRANRADMSAIRLRQRVLVDVSARTTATTILGEKVPLPLALGPVAMTGLECGNGEILACRGAQAMGIPFTLSTMSICSIEDVADAVQKPFWFQLYVMKDRGFVRSLVERAAAANCSALVLTVDLQVLGQRHCDIKNGLSVPPSLKIKNLINMASKPGWVLGVMTGKRWTFGNLAGHVRGMEGVKSLAQWVGTQFDASLSWRDVEWIRSIWSGKLILKGILDVKDAKLAAESGADALVVSNHGGRNLTAHDPQSQRCQKLPRPSAHRLKLCSTVVSVVAKMSYVRWRLARKVALLVGRISTGWVRAASLVLSNRSKSFARNSKSA